MIVPCEDLPEGQPDKDRENVRLALRQGRERFVATPNLECWRQALRVGVMGPLECTETMLKRLETQFCTAVSADIFPGMVDCELEILTPNAPGFDRAAVVRLLKHWHALTGRRGRVLLLNVARRPLVDRIAAEHMVARPLGPDDAPLLDRLSAEEKSMRDAAKGYVREIDMRPLGVSDTDLDTDRAAYFEGVRAVQSHIMALADIMIFETNSGQSRWTAQAHDVWDGPHELRIRLS